MLLTLLCTCGMFAQVVPDPHPSRPCNTPTDKSALYTQYLQLPTRSGMPYIIIHPFELNSEKKRQKSTCTTNTAPFRPRNEALRASRWGETLPGPPPELWPWYLMWKSCHGPCHDNRTPGRFSWGQVAWWNPIGVPWCQIYGLIKLSIEWPNIRQKSNINGNFRILKWRYCTI